MLRWDPQGFPKLPAGSRAQWRVRSLERRAPRTHRTSAFTQSQGKALQLWAEPGRVRTTAPQSRVPNTAGPQQGLHRRTSAWKDLPYIFHSLYVASAQSTRNTRGPSVRLNTKQTTSVNTEMTCDIQMYETAFFCFLLFFFQLLTIQHHS